METKKQTIIKHLKNLNNKNSKEGGFYLPNIQRDFVWKEDQIIKLYDSLMRKYPIGLILIWKTKEPIKMRMFIEDYKKNMKTSSLFIPATNILKMLVLDGQQRLQSLYIGLKGTYEEKELYLNLLSNMHPPTDNDSHNSFEDNLYEFKFLQKEQAKFPWFKLKDIIYENDENNKTKSIFENNILSEEEKETIAKNIKLTKTTFIEEYNIIFHILDNSEDEQLYKTDDIVEIFSRVNTGGTPLGKSDLLFSLLAVSWDDVHEHMEDLQTELNQSGFSFNRDFIFKTSLTLLDKGSAFRKSKLDDTTIKTIIYNWEFISNAISDVKKYLDEETYIRNNKTLTSYLMLIPLIYFRYKFKDKWKEKNKKIIDYILITLITGAFSNSPDLLINKLIKDINDKKNFDVDNLFNIMKMNGCSLEISKDYIVSLDATSKDIHLFLNYWYKDSGYSPKIDNSLQIDFVFPHSLLKSVKLRNPKTGRKSLLKYKIEDRRQIANCMLLSKKEISGDGRGKSSPKDFFKDKSEQYLDLHLIPKNKELWELDNFEKFIEERKKLIVEKFKNIIINE